MIVWQVRDTANAVYSVDDFTQFVTIQTETAVRHIASSYPYDNRGSESSPCATPPMRSPSSCRLSSPCGSGRPASTSSSHASPGCPTPRRSPRPCCASSRPGRSSARGSA